MVFNKQKATAFVAERGSPGPFLFKKGVKQFDIVRWIGALGTPHTIIASDMGDRTLFVHGLLPAPFMGCLVLFDLALRVNYCAVRATFLYVVICGEFLLYLPP